MTELSAMFEEDKAPAAEAVTQTPSAASASVRQKLDDWEASLPGLMTRFPTVKVGTLYCVYKVQLNPDVDFRDIQAEAHIRAIPLSGRSLHQAKVLLGIEKPRPTAPRRRKAAPVVEDDEPEDFVAMPYSREEEETALRRTAVMQGEVPLDVEGLLRGAIRSAVEKKNAVYRKAIGDVLALLDEVLAADDDET
ncbi:MAG: hypothetical protein HZB39_00990 [Planctomycetes bacterium]|nr:hypothetical protein [Planctomycetota bacterium]